MLEIQPMISSFSQGVISSIPPALPVSVPSLLALRILILYGPRLGFTCYMCVGAGQLVFLTFVLWAPYWLLSLWATFEPFLFGVGFYLTVMFLVPSVRAVAAVPKNICATLFAMMLLNPPQLLISTQESLGLVHVNALPYLGGFALGFVLFGAALSTLATFLLRQISGVRFYTLSQIIFFLAMGATVTTAGQYPFRLFAHLQLELAGVPSKSIPFTHDYIPEDIDGEETGTTLREQMESYTYLNRVYDFNEMKSLLGDENKPPLTKEQGDELVHFIDRHWITRMWEAIRLVRLDIRDLWRDNAEMLQKEFMYAEPIDDRDYVDPLDPRKDYTDTILPQKGYIEPDEGAFMEYLLERSYVEPTYRSDLIKFYGKPLPEPGYTWDDDKDDAYKNDFFHRDRWKESPDKRATVDWRYVAPSGALFDDYYASLPKIDPSVLSSAEPASDADIAAWSSRLKSKYEETAAVRKDMAEFRRLLGMLGEINIANDQGEMEEVATALNNYIYKYGLTEDALEQMRSQVDARTARTNR